MVNSLIIGSTGVGLLLTAFLLNLFGILRYKSKIYILSNIFGAYLACYASVLIEYWPFAVLEGTWALIAITRLITVIKKPC